MESTSSDWANTPTNVLHTILDKLSLPWFCEYAYFACVCKQWLAVAGENYRWIKKKYNLHGDRLPILMVPSKDNDDVAKREPYYLMKNEENVPCESFQFSVVLPPDCIGVNGCSSNGGWIATWNKETVITLVNPFVNDTVIRLPPLDEHHHAPCVQKVAMSSSPLDSSSSSLSSSVVDAKKNYIVAAIYGPDRRLAFMKSGDKEWNYLTDFLVGNIDDVIFYKGRILAIGIFGPLYKVDVISGAKGRRDIIRRICSVSQDQTESYLAASQTGDDVFVFTRFYQGELVGFPPTAIKYTTTSFKIHRLRGDRIKSREDDNGLVCDEMSDDAAFLGDNYSMCIEASRVPGGCKPNCIYYTDVDVEMYGTGGEHRTPALQDMGIFNAKDGSLEQHYKADGALKKNQGRPFWVFVAQPRFKL